MTEMHNALFFGKVVNVKYTVQENRDTYYEGNYGNYGRHYSSYHRRPVIAKWNDFVKYKQFYNCDFEKPPLNTGEKVYINELDLTLMVLDRVRSTNGQYCYYVEHVVETIENEESEKSLAEAKVYLEKELERYNEIKGYDERIKELTEKKKKWYHFFK